MPARALVPQPAGQGALEGAAVWMVGVTAYGGLVKVGLLSSDRA